MFSLISAVYVLQEKAKDETYRDSSRRLAGMRSELRATRFDEQDMVSEHDAVSHKIYLFHFLILLHVSYKLITLYSPILLYYLYYCAAPIVHIFGTIIKVKGQIALSLRGL